MTRSVRASVATLPSFRPSYPLPLAAGAFQRQWRDERHLWHGLLPLRHFLWRPQLSLPRVEGLLFRGRIPGHWHPPSSAAARTRFDLRWALFTGGLVGDARGC